MGFIRAVENVRVGRSDTPLRRSWATFVHQPPRSLIEKLPWRPPNATPAFTRYKWANAPCLGEIPLSRYFAHELSPIGSAP
jgi:hypothetical protein